MSETLRFTGVPTGDSLLVYPGSGGVVLTGGTLLSGPAPSPPPEGAAAQIFTWAGDAAGSGKWGDTAGWQNGLGGGTPAVSAPGSLDTVNIFGKRAGFGYGLGSVSGTALPIVSGAGNTTGVGLVEVFLAR